MKIRIPAVAGHFYPGDKATLQELLKRFIQPQPKIKNVFGVIAPHAGYIYSGKTAGKVYSSIDIPNTVVILSPNHTGMGSPISLDPTEKWSTPLGTIETDLEVLNKIKKRISQAELDGSAQVREHALEVHLPFIQTINPNAKIVPITVSNIPLEFIQKLGITLSEIIIDIEKYDGYRPLIVASSDMTHFEDVDTAKMKDTMAIEKIKKLDTKGFIDAVEKNGISLCGLYTISVLIEAVNHYAKYKKLIVKTDLIDYTTSAEVTGDKSNVVAYAGIALRLE